MTEVPHITLYLGSLVATRRVGLAIGAALPQRAILLFFGELGAGKTTLIKSICEGLGIAPVTVISPTYTLVNIYPGTATVYHADLLRLDSPQALAEMDRGDWLNPGGPTLIEWPRAALPWLEGESVLRLDLSHAGDHERVLALSGPADRYGPVFAALEPLRSRRASGSRDESRPAPG
jgi:tRNA threonylcarbamoyladenosine biosynthesis protein TsaE